MSLPDDIPFRSQTTVECHLHVGGAVIDEEEYDDLKHAVRRKLSHTRREFTTDQSSGLSRQPTPPESWKSQRAVRRPSIVREAVEIPCSRRIKTQSGAEEISEKESKCGGDLYHRFLSFASTGLSDSNLAASFLKGLEEKEKIEIIAKLNDTSIESKDLLQIFLKFSMHSSLDKMKEALLATSKYISVDRVRIVELDLENCISKSLLTGRKVTDNALAIRCVEAGSTILSNDLEGSVRPGERWEMEKADSIISMPIVINVGHDKSRITLALQFLDKNLPESRERDFEGFTAQDRSSAEFVTILISRMAENFYRKQNAKQQRAQLRSLTDAASAVCVEMDGPKLIENLVRLVPRLVPCQIVTLYLSDRTKKVLHSTFATKAITNHCVQFGEGVVGHAAEKMETVFVRDLTSEDSPFDPEIRTEKKIEERSVMAIPLIADSQLLGVLYLVNKIACDLADPILPQIDQNGKRHSGMKIQPHLVQRTVSGTIRMPSKSNSEKEQFFSQTQTSLLDEKQQGTRHMSFRMPPSRSNSHLDGTLESGGRELSSSLNGRKNTFLAAGPGRPSIGEALDKSELLKINSSKSFIKLVPSATSTSILRREQSLHQLTYFTDFHQRICSIICVRLAQALRLRLINYQFGQALSENQDASELLRSLISDESSGQVKDSKKNQITGYRMSFQAIGKFMKTLRESRSNSSSGAAFDSENDTSKQGVAQSIENECSAIIKSKALPDRDVFAALANLHRVRRFDQLDEDFCEWNFDVLAMEPDQLKAAVCGAFSRAGMKSKFRVGGETMAVFVEKVKEMYLDNPYHNWFHAVMVFQMAYTVLLHSSAANFLHFQDVFALLVASLCHDIGHTGRTNEFESKKMSELALRYNDHSVLEQYHASLTFTIILQPESNIMAGMSAPKFKEIRKLIVTHILNTDMKTHGDMLAKVKGLLIQAEQSESGGGMAIHREVAEERELLCSFVLHSCDIGAQTSPPDIAIKWTHRVLAEFKAQADEEEALGLQPTPFIQNLGDPSVQANLQFGFIGFIVEPTWETVCSLLPECAFLLENLKKNKEYFEAERERYKQMGAKSSAIEEETKEDS